MLGWNPAVFGMEPTEPGAERDALRNASLATQSHPSSFAPAGGITGSAAARPRALPGCDPDCSAARPDATAEPAFARMRASGAATSAARVMSQFGDAQAQQQARAHTHRLHLSAEDSYFDENWRFGLEI